MLAFIENGDDLSIILANLGTGNQQEAAKNQLELACIAVGRQRLPDPEQPDVMLSPAATCPPSSHLCIDHRPEAETATDACGEQIPGDTRPRQSPAQRLVAAGLVI